VTRRTGHVLATRVRDGGARQLEHNRAARKADERRDAKQDEAAPRPPLIEDERVLRRAFGLELVLTRHTQTGQRAVSFRRTRTRSGFVERFVIYPAEIEAVHEALASAVPDLAASDAGTAFRPRRP
jgi:hypothetical protein